MTASVGTRKAPPVVPDQFQSFRWILGAMKDFWFLHAGCGILVAPVALAAWYFPQLFLPLFVLYSVGLGLPHIAATHVRLNLDEDCKVRFRWLAIGAPFAIMGALAAVLYAIKTPYGNLLPYLVGAWFLLQTWHANAQNYGIMRRYVRMAGMDPAQPVSRLAEAMIQVIPWAFVLTCCFFFPSGHYLSYPIQLPTVPWPFEATAVALGFTVIVAGAYLTCEVVSWAKGEFVPGRFLCVVAGTSVNFMAWIIVREISWAYIVVSTWHALQYIAYTHAFRQTPPPGIRPFRLTLGQNVGLLFGLGFLVKLASVGIACFLTPLMIVVHIGMNFHHYLSDMLIWRKPKTSIS